MARRDMAVQSAVVLTLIIGIVGGNFCVHRWLLSDVTSRTADAGTAAGQTQEMNDLDLSRFAPHPAQRSRASASDHSAAHDRLRALIAERLPNVDDDERAVWLESLRDVPLDDVNGILELRQQLGPLPQMLEEPAGWRK